MLETIPNGMIQEGFVLGRDEGIAIGKAEGKVEGKAERNVEIAHNMKQKGYSAKDIADLTGLSIAEVERLD